MDDFRRRYDVPRRDYGMTPGQPVRPPTQNPQLNPSGPDPAPPTQPHHRVAQHPHQTPNPPHQAYQPEAQPTLADHQPTHPAHHAPQPNPHRASTKNSLALSRLMDSNTLKIIAAAVVGLLIVFAVISLKPSKPKSVLPADLAKQASFSVYYPESLPPGFIYDKSISTFANGQAYYLLNKGTEHIVVREQAWSSAKLDTSSLTKPEDLPTTVGKAAIGTNTGQTAAVVLAGTTLINITSNGSVSKDEMTMVINGLKNISQAK